MNILILSVTAGFGHIATAQAVHDALKERGANVDILDTLKYISTILDKTVSEGYMLSTKFAPKAYRVLYEMLDKRNKESTFASGVELFQNIYIPEKFVRMVEGFEPDVIICTHIFATQIVDTLKRKGRITCKVVGIITDYTIHQMWSNIDMIDYIVTPNELLTLQAVKKGISEERILPFGIPINPKFKKTMPKAEAREKIGLDPERATVLIMAGGMGLGKMPKTISLIESLKLGVQIIAVCGNNHKQYNMLMRRKYDNHIKIYGFITNVDELMDAADCIITKPGGLTMTEALSKLLPMIVIDPIPGQEERNTEFLLNNGLALHVTKTFPLDEAISYLFHGEGHLDAVRSSIKAIAKPNATDELTDFVIGLCEDKYE